MVFLDINSVENAQAIVLNVTQKPNAHLAKLGLICMRTGSVRAIQFGLVLTSVSQGLMATMLLRLATLA